MAKRKARITERVWLDCDTRSADLANFALPRQTDRKIRLYGVACCSALGPRLGEWGRRGLEVAARYADGMARALELRAACQDPSRSVDRSGPGVIRAVGHLVEEEIRPHPEDWDGWTSFCAGGSFADFFLEDLFAAAAGDPLIEARATALLRDVCGNPFRRMPVGPRRLTADVVALARGIYEEQAFDRLPILADALQDAGCADERLLGHCRGSGPHVRGCWVVDLVLGKE